MKKVLMAILGVLLAVCGFVMIVRPLQAFSTLGYVIGAVLLVNGIANIVLWFKMRKVEDVSTWFLISAILSVIIALAVLFDIMFKIAFEVVLVYIVAIWFVVIGIMRIVLAFKTRKAYKEGLMPEGKAWGLILLMGILLLICGILCIAEPFILALTIGMLLGVNMMFCGIDLVAMAFVIE